MGNLSARLWSDILLSLRTESPELARPWFNTLEPRDLQHGVIQIQTSSNSQCQYLRDNCKAAFARAAQKVTGRIVSVDFIAPLVPLPEDRPLSFDQDEGRPRLNENYIFENFVVGPSNRLAQAACMAVANQPGRVYNPLFIHGGVGLGKTHLLQAVCHHVMTTDESKNRKVLYLTCETFTNHFIEAIERAALQHFQNRYRHVDLLVIDDIQFLSARERSREEFFHTFNTLYQAQKQIILSADEAPDGIPSLEDRLVSRFNWGLVARIDPPCLETRMAILRKKSIMRCADLPDDVIHFIAARVLSNTRELEGALTKVLAISQQYGGHITLDIAKQALGDIGPKTARPISVTDIINIVTTHFNVRAADLQGKRRHRSLAWPRQVCMYLARELTPMSLDEIGGYFGGRDHTTVLHATRTVAEQRVKEPELENALQSMTQALHRCAISGSG